MQIHEDISPLRYRSSWMVVALILLIGVIHIRVADLEVLHGSFWRAMAENNRLRSVPIAARRGRIYDRNGLVLATNTPSFDLLLFPDEARHLDVTALFLARSGIASARDLCQRLQQRAHSSLAPVLVAENLTWDQVARVRAHQSDHPELAVVSGFRRHYPNSELAAHVVGHLRLLTERELATRDDANPDTLVGATGAEEMMEDFVGGRGGRRQVVVSAIGQRLGVVGESPPQDGHDITLTVDLRLQRVAANALSRHSGAVVALDPHSGAVRVLYSAPSFDSNLFTARLTPQSWAQIRDDPEHPLQDRCIQGVYPPASTIKPFLALAALEDGLIRPTTSIYCSGSVVLFGHTFHCWRRGGHGRVDMTRALEVSCDSYFYLLGQRLGIDQIARWLQRFGFGSRTGLGFPAEQPGLVGTPEWAQRVRHRPWYPGTTVSVSIGQGPLLVTPLQLAVAYAELANGGHRVQPHLVERAQPPQVDDLGLDPQDLATVRKGLWDVVHGSDGTARSLAALPIAGKTGTAQVIRLRDDTKPDELEERFRHHALFVGWAPLQDPRLVVAAVVEHGGGGSATAAPVVAAVLRAALAETGDTPMGEKSVVASSR
ncbi:MAG: penicillin-binding protein 2 [Acidobacteria bacterium]|nr:penicillin-binding protein 2 [Acidobacteriota bacterium]